MARNAALGRTRPQPARTVAGRRTTNDVGRSTKSIGDSGWSGLFASRTLARLLTVFASHPDATYYQRELAELAGSGLYPVQRELARLTRAGLIERTPRGNRVYYRANVRHAAFGDLKPLVLKTFGLGDALRAALAPLAARVYVALVFGSLARGEETSDSDIDLLLVGTVTSREAAAAIGPVGRAFGREANLAVYPPQEFRRKAGEGHRFVTEILGSDRIFLIGDADELGRLVG